MRHFDYAGSFLPDSSPLEIFLRGTVTYLAILFLLRLVLTRQSSNVNRNDLLVLVLVSDAAQNGMAGQYQSVADGIILVATIVFWSYSLDWLSFHSRFIARIVNPRPMLLVKDGKMQRRNMRRELVTPDELMSMLRQQGMDSLDGIKEAYLESDGNFSVVVRNSAGR